MHKFRRKKKKKKKKRAITLAYEYNSVTLGLLTKKSKVLRFQICSVIRTKYLSEICKNWTIEVGATKLFSVNSSWTLKG